MKIKYCSFELTLSEVFAVSSNARTSTECIFVEIEAHGKKGYGQASFPPYLSEKREKNLRFLEELSISDFNSCSQISDAFNFMDSLPQGNSPAKAAVDIALHDLAGKIDGVSLHQLLEIPMKNKIYSSITIGIGDEHFIRRKVNEAKEFKFIKVKLGSDLKYNLSTISLIQKLSTSPVGVDFNSALKEKEIALEHISILKEMGVVYVEQPFPKQKVEEQEWLKQKSPITIFGDESFQGLEDLQKHHHLFDGVNIKLMKCGGIKTALEMVKQAKIFGLQTMIGCMTESSCAVAAAAHLSPLFDRIDLDGSLLVKNDPFSRINFLHGELLLSENSGIGLKLSNESLF